MRTFFENFIPRSMAAGALVVGLTASVLLAAMIGAGHLLPRDSIFIYGAAIFCGLPFLIGILTPVVIGYRNEISVGTSIGYSLIALLVVGFSLLFLALEGVICIVMASPLVVIFTVVGSFIGYGLHQTRLPKRTNVFRSFLAFLLILPALSLFEGSVGQSEDLTPVTTSIEINAPPETVWKNVVEFPELAAPTELMFQTGIAYPIKAEIKGAGVSAVRYCEFSTGAFVEPVTVWDENKLLRFSVESQPIPMREISPYGSLDTPHLHDYFVSKQGQFKLTRLENGNTLLEGTTWYYHRIRPEFYWKHWTEEIVHTIHQRVLNHIKEQSEKEVNEKL